MIAEKGFRDGFVNEASDLRSSCWFLILWPFISIFFWVVMLSLGLVQSEMANALGVQGASGIQWNVFLARLINFRFNVRPFGQIPFSVLSAVMICLGVIVMILGRQVKKRKLWAVYPGLLIHLGVAFCAATIAIVTGSGTDWDLSLGMNADMFITLVLGFILGLIFLMNGVLSVINLVSILRSKTGK